MNVRTPSVSDVVEHHSVAGRCEICGVEAAVEIWEYGGVRPGASYRKSSCRICRGCKAVALGLLAKKRIKFRLGSRDTTNSRFSLLKASIKRQRFGHPNISARKLRAGQGCAGPGAGMDKVAVSGLELEINEWF
jgi:hypothetical protein